MFLFLYNSNVNDRIFFTDCSFLRYNVYFTFHLNGEIHISLLAQWFLEMKDPGMYFIPFLLTTNVLSLNILNIFMLVMQLLHALERRSMKWTLLTAGSITQFAVI